MATQTKAIGRVDQFRGKKIRSPWWRQIHPSMTCPLSGQPIASLRYPPFKFDVELGARKGRFVDSRYLALMWIVRPDHARIGRKLDIYEISCLDTHLASRQISEYLPGQFTAMWHGLNKAKTHVARTGLLHTFYLHRLGAIKYLKANYTHAGWMDGLEELTMPYLVHLYTEAFLWISATLSDSGSSSSASAGISARQLRSHHESSRDTSTGSSDGTGGGQDGGRSGSGGSEHEGSGSNGSSTRTTCSTMVEPTSWSRKLCTHRAYSVPAPENVPLPLRIGLWV